MQGFYLILDSAQSIAEFGPKLGAVCACAVYYHPLPELPPGEPDQVHAEGNKAGENLRVEPVTYVDEEEVRATLEARFKELSVKTYFLTYGSMEFLAKLAPLILNDPHLWVLGDSGLVAGTDFVRDLKINEQENRTGAILP
jgi:hypothetical protein